MIFSSDRADEPVAAAGAAETADALRLPHTAINAPMEIAQKQYLIEFQPRRFLICRSNPKVSGNFFAAVQSRDQIRLHPAQSELLRQPAGVRAAARGIDRLVEGGGGAAQLHQLDALRYA